MSLSLPVFFSLVSLELFRFTLPSKPPELFVLRVWWEIEGSTLVNRNQGVREPLVTSFKYINLLLSSRDRTLY